MTHKWLLIASVTAIVLGTMIEHYAKRPKKKAMKQFAQDVTEHPDYSDYLSKKLDERSARLNEARDKPAPDPFIYPDLINDLLSNEELDIEVAKIRLEKAGVSAESALLATLDDPRCHWNFANDTWSTKAPAQRVAHLLERIPCKALGEHLAHLIDHPDWRVNTIAIKARAALGKAELLPWVLESLESKDGLRQQTVEKGVDKSIAQSWAEPAFLQGLLEWSRQSLVDSSRPHSWWAVKHFAQYGGQEALALMQSSAILSLDNNRTIHFVLEELTKRKIRINAALLRQIIDKSLADDAQWPWNCTFRYALNALAQVDLCTAEKIAQSQLMSQNEDRSEDSSKFLRLMHGLPRYWQTAPPPGCKISPAEQEIITHLDNCSEVIGQVQNGGLSQYFFNCSGDNWPQAIQSLRVVGCNDAADAVAQASKVLHPRGASIDRDIRMKQYAKLSEKKEDQLDDLDRHFRSAYIDRQMLTFMLQHTDFFRRIKKARIAAGWDKD